MFKGIKGIAYDLDGTITDTSALHEKAWLQAARELDIPLPNDFLENQKGLVGEEAARLVCTDHETADRLSDLKRKCVAEMTGEIRVHSDFFETNEQLRIQGIQTWICTSAPEAFIDRLFDQEDRFASFVSKTVYREMYTKGKPDAEPLQLAFSKMNLEEAECLYVGDAYADYQAAKNAKCGFVYFSTETPDPRIPDEVPRISKHTELLELI